MFKIHFCLKQKCFSSECYHVELLFFIVNRYSKNFYQEKFPPLLKSSFLGSVCQD